MLRWATPGAALGGRRSLSALQALRQESKPRSKRRPTLQTDEHTTGDDAQRNVGSSSLAVAQPAAEPAAPFQGQTDVFLPLSRQKVSQWSEEWADIADRTFLTSPRDVSIDVADMTPAEKWERRKREFSMLRRRVLLCLQSHHNIRDKALMTLGLFDNAVENHMVFHPFIYERMLDALRLATHPDVQPGIRAARYRDTTANSAIATKAGVHAQLCPIADGAWAICEFMFRAAVKITPDAAENMMVMLAKVNVPNPEVERRAHELVLRLDALHVTPTRVFLSEYFSVCKVNKCMHIAVARYADAKLRHEITPDAQMATRIISGLVHNDQINQALRFIGTLGSIAVDRPLINACVDAARRAADPLSAFDMWVAVAAPSSMFMDEYTVTTLLAALVSHRAAYNGMEYNDLANIAAAPKGAGVRAAKLRLLTREILRARLRLPERITAKFATMLHATVYDLAHIAILRSERGDEASPAQHFPEAGHAIYKTAAVLRRRLGGFDRSSGFSKGKVVYLWRWALKIDTVADRVGLPKLVDAAPGFMKRSSPMPTKKKAPRVTPAATTQS